MARARRNPTPPPEAAAPEAVEAEALTPPVDLKPHQAAPVSGEHEEAPAEVESDPDPESLASPEAETYEEEISEDHEIWEGPGGTFRQVMWLRGQLVFENLDHFQENPSEDVVHDLRVASRRLNACLDLAAELIGKQPVRKAQEQLRDLRQSLGDLRDLHIQLDWLKDHLETLPQLQERVDHLQAQEARCWSKATKAIKKVRARKLGKRLEGVDALVGALVEGSDGWDDCLQMLRRSVAKRFGTVLSQHKELNPGVGASLHALRIAFKRFRYKAELVGQLEDPPRGPEHAEAMRAIQRALGGLQDLEVLTQGLERGWVETPPDREGQMAVLQHLLEHRRTELEQLGKATAALETLWEVPSEG